MAGKTEKYSLQGVDVEVVRKGAGTPLLLLHGGGGSVANQPFVGNVQIIADKRTPYRTLSEVIYTLGQTEFKNLRFVVNKKSQ